MDQLGHTGHPPKQNQAKTALPESVRGLCWGGFFLNWIWSIGNKTWIGLLTLVPFVGLVMPFVLLFKGREWAWKNDSWESPEHFNSTQKIWSIVGLVLVLFGCIPIIGILAAIAIPNFVRYQVKAEQSEAKTQLAAIYTAEKSVMSEKGAFSSDLHSLGIDFDGSLRYRVGFTSSSPDFAQYCSDCIVNEKSFKAVAIGKIGSEGKMDVWTIDQDRNLLNTIDGTR
jgi:Tfp pilus assembly protein PilE